MSNRNKRRGSRRIRKGHVVEISLIRALSHAFGRGAGKAEVDWRWRWSRSLVETRRAGEAGRGFEGGTDIVAKGRVGEDGETLAGVVGGC